MQGHQKNDFILNPPKQRAQTSRAAKGAKAQEVVYPAKQKWALDPEVDVDTRRVCEARSAAGPEGWGQKKVAHTRSTSHLSFL